MSASRDRVKGKHVVTATLALVPGCAGVQSTFSPFGAEADTTLRITWLMIVAAAAITAGVLLLARHAVRSDGARIDHRRGMRLILWLGAVFPTLTLAALLGYSLPTMRPLSTTADDLRIAVDGEQFWWRVRYRLPPSTTVETANEIRVPVGRTVTFELAAADVVHSFWIPGLAGKMDMIPGRTNELVVRATRAGVFRGACAEFCGLSHALMAFDVIVMAPTAFDAWLTELARPAVDVIVPGRQLFLDYGCAGCHVIRGHSSGTPIGPDLTHFGARRSFGAGVLPMTIDEVGAFVRDPSSRKSGVRMPTFAEMSIEDAHAIASYLLELR